MRIPRRSWLWCFLGVLLTAGCDGSGEPTALVADPAAAHALVAERPFHFALTGNANPDFSNGPCSVTNTEAGSGVAEHLGAVTWTSEELVSFCVDPADPTVAEANGSLVLTAANGDRLTATYVAIVRADFGGGTLTAEGDFVITGGTGRFEHATGNGQLGIEGSLLPPFEVAGAFTGTLAY